MNPKNKIAIFGIDSDDSLEKYYFDAFKKLKYKKIIFIDNKIFFKIYCLINKLNFFFLIKIFNFFQLQKFKYILNKYDINFLIIFKGIELNSTIFNLLKNKGIKLINIYTDDPFNFSSSATSSKNIINNIVNFDYFCIWSKKIKKKLKQKYKNNIFFYLPFGYSKKNHIKLKSQINKNKITFVASYDHYRLNIINKIKRNIDIYGNSWPNVFRHKKHKFIKNKKTSEVISSSEISLNILKKQNLSSHNMRTFEIPAMGGLMLTTRSKEQQQFFPENKACFMYDGLAELNNKIEYIIQNSKKASKIRKKGYKLSKQFSYENRLKSLIKFIKKHERINSTR